MSDEQDSLQRRTNDQNNWPTSTPAQIIEGVRRILGEEIVVDVVKPPLEALGQGLGDTVKLVFIGLNTVIKAAGSKIYRLISRIEKEIPENRRITPPQEVLGPALEGMRFLPNGHPLHEMFEELLVKACDQEQQNSVHPHFPEVIRNLAPEEALLLYLITRHKIAYVKLGIDHVAEGERKEITYVKFAKNVQSGVHAIGGDLPALVKKISEDKLEVYAYHLRHIGLVETISQVSPHKPNVRIGLTEPFEKYFELVGLNPVLPPGGKIVNGYMAAWHFVLSPFGEVFTQACIPSSGFGWFTADAV